MAETKTRPKNAKPKTRSTSKPKAKRRSTARRKPAASGSRSSNGGSPRAASKSGSSKPKEIVENVGEAAKEAGGTVGRAVSKAKVPLMAGGAALAGAAGGIALSARQSHRHRGLAGIDSDDLAKAAKRVGNVGVQVGELAYEARKAREASNGKHRSPIEVVLQGLTSRGSHH
jgi:hypothetical protein